MSATRRVCVCVCMYLDMELDRMNESQFGEVSPRTRIEIETKYVIMMLLFGVFSQAISVVECFDCQCKFLLIRLDDVRPRNGDMSRRSGGV